MKSNQILLSVVCIIALVLSAVINPISAQRKQAPRKVEMNEGEFIPKHGNFNLYLGGFGALTLDNFGGGAFAGWRWSQHIRTEVEFMYDGSQNGHHHGMASLAVDLFKANSAWYEATKTDIYIKGGLGVAQQTNYFRINIDHKLDPNGGNGDDNILKISNTKAIPKYNFAYNFGIGAAWRIAPHCQLRAEVLYVGYPTEKAFMDKIDLDVKEYSGDDGINYIIDDKLLEDFKSKNYRDYNLAVKVSVSYHF